MKLPWHWTVEQQVTTIDASTFPMYYNNMKTFLAEMVRKSELIIFNRCDGIEDLNSYKRNIKAINQKADIVFENSDGEVNEIMEDDLPYDLGDEYSSISCSYKKLMISSSGASAFSTLSASNMGPSPP